MRRSCVQWENYLGSLEPIYRIRLCTAEFDNLQKSLTLHSHFPHTRFGNGYKHIKMASLAPKRQVEMSGNVRETDQDKMMKITGKVNFSVHVL